MEKYSAISCPSCKGFKVEKLADCTALVSKSKLIKTATANTGETYRCRECQKEFTLPTVSSDSDERSE